MTNVNEQAAGALEADELRFAVNASMLFTELPLLKRPAAVREAGFDAIEFWWPFEEASPADALVDRFVSAVRDAGLGLVGLNFAAGDMPAGDRGLVSVPGRCVEFFDSVDVALGIAEQLGCRNFNALYGNRQPDVPPAEQDELAVENLARAVEMVRRVGGTVLVEPLSGADRYPLRTARDVTVVLDAVTSASTSADPLAATPWSTSPSTPPSASLAESGSVMMLADLYHLATNGDDIDEVIALHTDRIGHVQVADAPGRHQPGTGQLRLGRHLRALHDAGYTGWISLEYAPDPTTLASLEWLPPHRRSATPTPAASDAPRATAPQKGDHS